MDFNVCDYKVDWKVPIVLGRPFLAIGYTLINVHKGELTMRVQDKQVIFNVLQPMKYPNNVVECLSILVVDSIVSKELEKCYYGDSFKDFL